MSPVISRITFRMNDNGNQDLTEDKIKVILHSEKNNNICIRQDKIYFNAIGQWSLSNYYKYKSSHMQSDVTRSNEKVYIISKKHLHILKQFKFNTRDRY